MIPGKRIKIGPAIMFVLIFILTESCQKQDTLTCLIPELISPKNNAILDNGCTYEADAINWSFEWTGCPTAIKYNLYVKHPAAENPVIDIQTTELKFIFSENGYISDRANWRWKVRAFHGGIYGGVWGKWSKERTFQVEEANNDCK